MKQLFRKSEFFIGLTIIAISLFVGFLNESFYSVANIFDLLRSTVVIGILAMGVLLVLISGGIDVSFPAIAIFSYYATIKLLNVFHFDGGIIWILIVAAGIGLLLGLFNSIFIAFFKMQTLIATLGTATLYRGILFVFLGTTVINQIPNSLTNFGKSSIFKIASSDGTSGLSSTIILLVIVALVTWILLKYTIIGRGIYALGGDPTSAKRIGFNLTKLQIFIYGLVGIFSGIAGVVHGSTVRNANPFDLFGIELNVIAAVVLGGARITGGYGNVQGTLLGVFLVVLINNNLILMGVSSYWQKVVIGMLILVGTSITSYQSRMKANINLLGEEGGLHAINR
ncbi:ABC transporter permease [Bacillus sp. FJAT-50079]|uniref:ABC transporter permease n=1 Tax=Bacillus sp. FJAT-50079 TaxID=2833577 RepID=UPI001BC9F5F7|nr:ABC transporter permease [Bacillus sp. FJAT-50079]MBS4210484.1 ABC transporter permease [Bacillus sp. FJAT-50079]